MVALLNGHRTTPLARRPAALSIWFRGLGPAQALPLMARLLRVGPQLPPHELLREDMRERDMQARSPVRRKRSKCIPNAYRDKEELKLGHAVVDRKVLSTCVQITCFYFGGSAAKLARH
jgi:hypothetical protein